MPSLRRQTDLEVLRFVLIVAVLVSLLVPASPAQSFDQWAIPSPDDDVNTCFTNHEWWTTHVHATKRKNEANAAVAAWEQQVSGLNLNHSPTGSCPSSDVELDWVEHLDGSLARTMLLNAGPVWIRFAQRDGHNEPYIPWSYDDDPHNGGTCGCVIQYDFRSTVIHELGHAMGIKHPENNAPDDDDPWWWVAKSYDGRTIVMKGSSAMKGTLERRTLSQDDVSAGNWARTHDHWSGRNFIANMRNDNADFWGSVNGTLTDCASYFVCYEAASYTDSWMYMTTRLTTGTYGDRDQVKMIVVWRRKDGRSGGAGIRMRVRWNSVASDGSKGGYTYWWSPVCVDDSPGDAWETCEHEFPVMGSGTVKDVRVFIYNKHINSTNSSAKTIEVNDVMAVLQ